MNRSTPAHSDHGAQPPTEEITQMYAKPVNDLYLRAQQRDVFSLSFFF